MGTVFEAFELQTGRRVALKVLNPDQRKRPESVARLTHEGEVGQAISHRNICAVLASGEFEGSYYVAMEFLEGETLAERLARAGALPLEEVIVLGLQVTAALEAAHGGGVVHRDLKPENLFLSRAETRSSAPWQVKLLDFGIAKQVAASRALHLTQTGMVVGTPLYMAPEQAMGEADLDGRVDLWALGVTLYEASSGRRPFVGATYNALLMNVVCSEPIRLLGAVDRMTVELEGVIFRALAKSRSDRFPSARAFGDALRGIQLPAAEPPAVFSEESNGPVTDDEPTMEIRRRLDDEQTTVEDHDTTQIETTRGGT